jgi:hypothetical protein
MNIDDTVSHAYMKSMLTLVDITQENVEYTV